MINNWKITVEIFRKKEGEDGHFDRFDMEVNPEEYVIDVVERTWAKHDRTLVYRHACHHATCGACGMVVNGVEKLTCITHLNTVVANGGTLRIEPLRNFPVISDLAVDMSALYSRMELVGARSVQPIGEAGAINPRKPDPVSAEDEGFMRLSDCIECGLCISACPIAATTPAYLGPAVLAAAQQNGLEGNPELMKLVDSEFGVWRCHSAYECTEVCPSNVQPGWRIMELRKQVVKKKFGRLFGGN
jgi:succinate dehydrogenase / fumarate reductase iron-sulfur subunit